MKDMLKQIWRLYWGSYESWPEKYMPKGEKKEKRFPPFMYKKSPPPITFLMVHTYFSKMPSQMIRNKGMRRTEIWALLLVRLLLADRKLK